MKEKLEMLYGSEAKSVYEKIQMLITKYTGKVIDGEKARLSETDSILITYGDSIIKLHEKPLITLEKFMNDKVKDAVKTIHILPFFPYSSDDGFSVIDYEKVDQSLGGWDDIKTLSKNYDLMFDGVINHISKESKWFECYLSGNENYKNYFIESDPNADYSKVVRPRTLPLLTAFEVAGEIKHVWTTFSEDQIDLNYKEPKVFLDIAEILIKYVKRGAKFIRLDAIGFAWKEVGTSCLHLEKTHIIIQLIREILTQVKRDVIIVTETNVPHDENISYFGNGYNEAHMVYQFALPPLTLHTLISGNSEKLTKWAQSLERMSDETTYFNFLASHDGIGLRPVEKILTADEKENIVNTVVKNGGFVSYKDNGDGTQSPYELNINYMDALNNEHIDENILIDKFIAATGILYSMLGVPGIYIHSILGSWNDIEGANKAKVNRRINREKLDYDRLIFELEQNERRKEVFGRSLHLLNIRKMEKAFHPYGHQEVITGDQRLFIIKRYSLDRKESIMVVINISDQKVVYQGQGINLITGKRVNGSFTLNSYEVVWLKEEDA